MKKYLSLALAFLLAASLLTACGCGNVSQDPGGRITAPTTEPASRPTNPQPTMTLPHSEPSTDHTQAAPSEPTHAPQSEATHDTETESNHGTETETTHGEKRIY